jgi:hypothetical protein
VVRHHHRIALAVALTLALIVTAPASAKFGRGLPYATTHLSHPTSTTVVSAQSNGFDWGDAGIGAGGALGVTALLLGSVLAASHTRRRAGHGSAQPTT